MNYYTYAFLRQDGTPYYIGKGKGRRLFVKRRGVNPPKDKTRIIYLKRNLTEAEAFKHEVYMIDILGRKDIGTGILNNLTNGGEGCSGFIQSDRQIELTRARMLNNNPTKDPKIANKIRQALLENHPRRGKKYTEEERKQLSQLMIEKRANVGEKSYLSQIWKITFNDGRVIEQIGLRRWATDNNYSPDCLYNIAKGKQKKHKDIIKVETFD